MVGSAFVAAVQRLPGGLAYRRKLAPGASGGGHEHDRRQDQAVIDPSASTALRGVGEGGVTR